MRKFTVYHNVGGESVHTTFEDAINETLKNFANCLDLYEEGDGFVIAGDIAKDHEVFVTVLTQDGEELMWESSRILKSYDDQSDAGAPACDVDYDESDDYNDYPSDYGNAQQRLSSDRYDRANGMLERGEIDEEQAAEIRFGC